MEDFMDWVIDHPIRSIAALIVVVLVIAWAGSKYEESNPCIKRGPREVMYWQKIGDIMMPVYHEPCLQRERE